jgi:hypothetical protein
MNREMTGRSQTLLWWWLGEEGVKTTESKITWHTMKKKGYVHGCMR